MSVPVIPVAKRTLVMPLVGALDTGHLLLLQEQALRSVERTAARTLIIDITGVPVVDSQVAQGVLAGDRRLSYSASWAIRLMKSRYCSHWPYSISRLRARLRI